MMTFLGNYRDWINTSLLETIISTQGDPTLLNQPKTWTDHPDHIKWYDTFCKAGYNTRNFYSNMYTKMTEDIRNYEITPPIDIGDKKWDWWFIKFLPGSVACMHYDPHTKIQETATRYWMAMMDYQPGHIFIYENKNMLTNYRAGDLYKFDRADLIHGVTNLSMSPRVTFQFTTFDPGNEHQKKAFYTDKTKP
jgi:hypothetical protein